MKKSLLICIAIILTQFSWAQTSLDSLRLLVQSTDYLSHELQIVSDSSSNYYFLFNRNSISVGDKRSGKLLHDQMSFLDYEIEGVLFATAERVFVNVSYTSGYNDNSSNSILESLKVVNSNILEWDLKSMVYRPVFSNNLTGEITGVERCYDGSFIMGLDHSIYRFDMGFERNIQSSIYKLDNLTFPDTSVVFVKKEIPNGFGLRGPYIFNGKICFEMDRCYYYDCRYSVVNELVGSLDDYWSIRENISMQRLGSIVVNDSMGCVYPGRRDWVLNFEDRNSSYSASMPETINFRDNLQFANYSDFGLTVASLCSDTIISFGSDLIPNCVDSFDFQAPEVSEIVTNYQCDYALAFCRSVGWFSELGSYTPIYFIENGRVTKVIESSEAVYSYQNRTLLYTDENLNCIKAKIDGIELYQIDTLATGVSGLTIINDRILIRTEENFLNNIELVGVLSGPGLIGYCSNNALSDVLVVGDSIEFSLKSQNGQELVECRILPNKNYLIKLPNSPYYMCSKDASKMLHYVTPSLKVIGFDQLDPVYNRPDIVLDSIGKYFGGSDKDLVANYRAAWEKRIDRLGLDKDKLSSGEIAVPNAEITNANQIQFENKVGKVVIHVEANDPKYTLRRYNVLVNEVPIYGSAGVSIADLNTQVWEHTDTITLSKGRNKIQVSIMNELGLENFKYPVYVNYSPEEIVSSKTYYVGIGVNHFNDASHDLKYCVKDVQDLARAFANNQSRVDTILFTDQEVTKENILALKYYLQNNTTVNDKVIISCSSHGLLDDSLNFYLATHDVDFSNPKERGLKYEELESLLDGIPARQKLLLLDACNSGENERLLIERNENNDLASNDPKKKGEELEVVNKEIQSFQRMNELFVNVRNNTGSIIISAAGGLQSALEAIEVNGKEIKNGAFTFSVLECLSKNNASEIKVNDLKLYVEKRVEEITKGKQKPTSRQETMEVDWVVLKF